MSAPSRSTSPDIKRLLRFIDRAERLEALPRTGWLVCGIERPESVAAHSYMVALIALWIADQLEEDIDAELLLRMALFHDLSEAFLTDIPGPVKELLGRKTVIEAETRASERILEEACTGWSKVQTRYQNRQCIESNIVKAADRIQMFAKAIAYDARRQGDMRRFLEEFDTDDFGIPLIGQIFEELKICAREKCWFPADLD